MRIDFKKKEYLCLKPDIDDREYAEQDCILMTAIYEFLLGNRDADELREQCSKYARNT